MSPENDRRSRRRILFWGLLTLAILLIVCTWFHGKHIPKDIARRAGQALTTADFDSTVLQAVDGRVAILSGEIDGSVDRERLVETVRSVHGVRRVIDKLVVIKAAPARMSLAITADTVSLGGVMPDQTAVEKAVNAAAAIYGMDKVINRITIQKQVEAPLWLDGLLALLPELKTAASIGIEASGSEVVLRGVADSPESQARIAAQAETLLGGTVAVDNRIRAAVTPQPAKLRYRIRAEEVLLEGELPDRHSVEKVVAVARKIYGQEKVKNELIISEDIMAPEWLDEFLELLPALETMTAADIAIDDDGLTLSGVVASDAERSAIERRAGDLLGNTRLINQIVVKSAALRPASAEQVQLPPLYFKHARTELTDESRPLLDEIVDTLKRRPELRVEIAAHTDSSGEEVLNVDLSERRTQAIVQYLVSVGIDPVRLVQHAYGEKRPVADNSTSEGRARNRRVEFKVIE